MLLAVAPIVALVLVAAVANANPIEKRQEAAVYYNCNSPNTVALTFDDGPWVYEWDLITYLNSQGIKGTFFVNGQNYDCIYNYDRVQSLKYAHNSGHLIGSHTWHHWDLSSLSWDQIHDEMWRVELAMRRILGVVPAFMRPPYGNQNGLVRAASAIRNQSLVIWSFDSGDSGSAPLQASQNYVNHINGHPYSILPLNHETNPNTVYNVIPETVNRLRQAGYQFATVADCLGLPPYSAYVPAEEPNGDWNCN